ncbi:hypothetical protein WJX72_011018 [[Myrmecia] bisecta]|uniref:Sulfhydryl oxidase n=1 Tax=[Myrmecia] bisecta TaxID=41462 RepID=A0AAW1PGC1_9CHLO
MEFYAHWCPSCQHFQPAYEKVAAYLNKEPRTPPEVVVARVDCASESALCNRFHITHYPTVKGGRPSDFDLGAGENLEVWNGERTAEGLLGWLGEKVGRKYDLNVPREHAEEQPSSAPARKAPRHPTQVDLADVTSATLLAFQYMVNSGDLLAGLESRQAFIDFVDMLLLSHPTDSCRAGCALVKGAIHQLWPPTQTTGPSPQIREYQICGMDTHVQDWHSCKGTKPNSRGYTCGLWMLFHTLAVRTEPADRGGALWMTAVRGFVQHFFQCSECAAHFVEMASQEAAAQVTSRRDAALWIWRAHNRVNKRLAEHESTAHDGDPAYPHEQWPPAALCPLCRLPALEEGGEAQWNEDEVYRFLVKFYGGVADGKRTGLGLLGRKQLAGDRRVSHTSVITNAAIFCAVVGGLSGAYRLRRVALMRLRKSPSAL